MNDRPAPQTPLDRLIYLLGAGGMLALFAVIIYEVGMRYLFSRPPLWSVDVPNLVFIWLVFVVVGLTTKLGPQIRVVFFVDRLPPRLRRALEAVQHLAVLLMLGTFIYQSLPIIALSSSQTMLSTGWPGSVYFYALPIGSAVMVWYQLGALRRLLTGTGGHDT